MPSGWPTRRGSSPAGATMKGDLSTLAQARRWAASHLSRAGVDGPGRDADLLLRHVLNLGPLDLCLSPDRPTSTEEQARLREVIVRRCRRVPLQYVTGETEFWSLPFCVTPDVLIPRPETEILVASVISVLKGLPAPRIADVGTGSGCIAVSLARELPGSRLVATDASRCALAVARGNARRSDCLPRIRFVAGDVLDALDSVPAFDAVVSNPPYIPSGEIAGLQPEVRDHEPRLALNGGEDGLRFHRRLVADALRTLRPGGWLAVEVGAGQMGRVLQMMSDVQAFGSIRHVRDLPGVSRVAMAQRR